MQMVLERSMRVMPAMSEEDAQAAVRRYVDLEIDRSLRVVSTTV